MGVRNCSMFCCALLYVHSSFAFILVGKRELAALQSLSSWCLMIVVWLILAVPWICLRFVIVVFPDHTHYSIRLNSLSFIAAIGVLVYFHKYTEYNKILIRQLLLELPDLGLLCLKNMLKCISYVMSSKGTHQAPNDEVAGKSCH